MAQGQFWQVRTPPHKPIQGYAFFAKSSLGGQELSSSLRNYYVTTFVCDPWFWVGEYPRSAEFPRNIPGVRVPEVWGTLEEWEVPQENPRSEEFLRSSPGKPQEWGALEVDGMPKEWGVPEVEGTPQEWGVLAKGDSFRNSPLWGSHLGIM